jgi:hypothetical protein
MWMSNILIVVDRRNADPNSLNDIAAAVREAGATVVAVDEPRHVIEAAIPTRELPTVSAMDGVAYVRCVFNYFCDPVAQPAA